MQKMVLTVVGTGGTPTVNIGGASYNLQAGALAANQLAEFTIHVPDNSTGLSVASGTLLWITSVPVVD